jgi:uncharacterized protein YjbI with pentapeptide repeats
LANKDQVARLKSSPFAEEWNEWRQQNPDIRPDLVEASLIEEDLSFADLRGADLRGASLKAARLSGADLSSADLSEANLGDAYFSGATLSGCDLKEADLSGANLFGVNLSEARLCGASLEGANFGQADFRGADLSNANLTWTNAVETNFTNANLTGCRVYGISAWGLKLDGATQQDLIITPDGEPEITVDNIEVAQFVYLLLHNEKIRAVIDTITSKSVLILGRFTPARKAVLDAMRDELRRRGYLPILFDFDKPASRDITETVSLLARMARFVLADITDAKSIPQELSLIVPDLPSVPVQPLLLKGSAEYSMFEHFRRYPWVLPIHHYDSPEQLIGDLGRKVIHPAEIKVQELRK